MSATPFTAVTTAVSLSAGVAKTLLQIVPATNAPIRVVELAISLKSVTSTDVPGQVDLLRQTTAGTSSSLTLVADQENVSKTVLATALQTFTAEPTAGNVIRSWNITPIGGLFVIQFDRDFGPGAMSNRIGIRANFPQAQTATAYLTFLE